MDSLKNLMLAGLGVMSYTQEKLKGAVDSLIAQGELSREQGEKVLEEWVKRGEDEQSKLGGRVQDEIQKVISRLQLITRDDFDALVARVEVLEKLQKLEK